MEDFKQLSKEEVQTITKGFPIEPLFNKVIVTLNREEDASGVIVSNTSLSDVQYVIAAREGSPVKAGDKVHLDMRKLKIKVPSETDVHQMIEVLNLDFVTVNDVDYTYIDDRVIKAIDRR